MPSLADAIYSLREGMEAIPREGDIETTPFWISLANTGNDTQRVSALIVLLRMGFDIEVKLRSK